MSSPTPPDTLDVPEERALLVVDMKGYSKIPEAKMAPVRSDLDDILATVLTHSGLTHTRSPQSTYKDTGDGAIIVLPARHTARLVDPLLDNLHQALKRYDRERLASAPLIRLRASVHVGPLTADHRGDAINEACRLVDSDAVRRAMAAAADNGSFLAAVVSDTAFRHSVRAGRTPDLNERQFLRTKARVDGKPDFEEVCWLFVPGLVPAMISPYLYEQGGAPQLRPREEGAPQERAEPQAVDGHPADVRQKAKASGKARLVQVGGDYITGRERS
ncbi:hypothetical protein [Streptomyces sp. NPDC052701]|uniref:hypothetical protein n=1 Tax=Streptomyces sp. NPDC052701 TaxID=3155533 RepID=UPI003439C222